jgi:hypothetical protein
LDLEALPPLRNINGKECAITTFTLGFGIEASCSAA